LSLDFHLILHVAAQTKSGIFNACLNTKFLEVNFVILSEYYSISVPFTNQRRRCNVICRTQKTSSNNMCFCCSRQKNFPQCQKPEKSLIRTVSGRRQHSILYPCRGYYYSSQKFATQWRRRFRPHKVYMFLVSITRRVDL